MKKKMLKMAICYDFDGTLSPEYMQNVCLLPELGFPNPKVFWDEVKKNAKKQNMDEILAYMNLLIDKAKEKNIPLTAKFLMKCGRKIRLYKGVETWFERINAYAKERNIDVEHYIITSGNEEIIRGNPVSKYFKYIFGCKFAYKKEGVEFVAEKPANAVNYTSKTQYLFRINKGVLNYYENEPVNRYMSEEEKRIEFSKIIYIGDGETDVPCFKMVSYQGGKSIAVYNPKRQSAQEIAMELFEHKRADFIAPADYSENSKLEKIVKNVIEKISLRALN